MESATDNPNGYKHVWVVYDTDDFPADHINRTSERCNSLSTDEIKYHAIWSNQCIELWLLQHFGFVQSDLHRSEYWPKLSVWLKSIGQGEYTKGRGDIFQVLWPYIDYAISNAERLDELNKGKTPANAAPGAKVYELIKYLKPYLKME